jgi:membrane-bound ClpP family serine protease
MGAWCVPRPSRLVVDYWAQYLALAVFFAGFAALIAEFLGAPAGVPLLVGIAAGVLAVAFLVGTWVKERGGRTSEFKFEVHHFAFLRSRLPGRGIAFLRCLVSQSLSRSCVELGRVFRQLRLSDVRHACPLR